ncbi:MAG: alpha/beta fold hydrolase [Acidimicrobiia bacterium]|nr:alpha/beta fold hydrolase [Acidimicrobiia bacterium]
MAARETPLFLTGPDGPLFAIHTSPEQPESGVILCPGGWHAGSANANRLMVRLARRLAAESVASIRFEWRGTGDSPGERNAFILDEPSPGAVLAGADQVPAPRSLVGVCFGSRSALAAAPEIADLEAIFLVSFPLPAARAKVRRAERMSLGAAIREGLRPATLRGWFDPATRRVYVKFLSLRWQKLRRAVGLGSSAGVKEAVARKARKQELDLDQLVSQLAALTERGVRVRFIFGTGDALYEQFTEARTGPLGNLMNRHPDLLDVAFIDGDLTGFSTLPAQEELLDMAVPWLSRSSDPAGG